MARRQRIVVDGSNVAHEERTKDGKPRVGNIVAVTRELRELGFDPIVVVDAALRHQIDDPDQLEALLDGRRLHDVPAGTDADYFILELAAREDADVLSNDMFRDREEQYGWIRKRRVPYMIVNGVPQLYEPKLNGHAPSPVGDEGGRTG